MYLPRQAIQTLEVVSLIGAPGRKQSFAPVPREKQPELFPGEPETA
jgi:hypothetical protein